ncbi:hypothetical protein [Pantoea ananatis]|uniref:hypothetical protein n=1 Tax=Pantoea ananas TaxID=553 RepID=UPI003F652655
MQFTALHRAPAKAVVLTRLLTRALTAANFPVQAVAGKFTDQLLIKANRADVTRTVVQPGKLLFTRQGQMGEVAQRIPFVIQFPVYTGFC